MPDPQLDEQTRTELEAAAFRRLVEHLRERTDVQNIDLMNLAGFCRNCLSRWYREAAEAKGIGLADPDCARDRLRHALQGMAGEIPEGGERRAEGSVREGQSGTLRRRHVTPTLPASLLEGILRTFAPRRIVLVGSAA